MKSWKPLTYENLFHLTNSTNYDIVSMKLNPCLIFLFIFLLPSRSMSSRRDYYFQRQVPDGGDRRQHVHVCIDPEGNDGSRSLLMSLSCLGLACGSTWSCRPVRTKGVTSVVRRTRSVIQKAPSLFTVSALHNCLLFLSSSILFLIPININY